MPRPPRKKIKPAPLVHSPPAQRPPLAPKSANFTPRRLGPASSRKVSPLHRGADARSDAISPGHNENWPSREDRVTTPQTKTRSQTKPATDYSQLRPVIQRSAARHAIPASSAVKATPSFVANFKRRPRQPSILSMVQQRHQDATTLGNDEDSELSEFSLGRSSPVVIQQEELQQQRQSSSLKRKRPSRHSDALRSQEELPEQILISRPPSPPRSPAGRVASSEPLREPETASPESSPIKSSARGRTKTKATKSRQTAGDKQKFVSTAALQEMLPKRRRRRAPRRQDEFEVLDDDDNDSGRSGTDESNVDESDESEMDELAARSSKGSAGARASAAYELQGARTYGKGARHKRVGPKSKAGYRGAAADPGTLEITSTETSEELKEMADKFREVDEWELEFESQDLGAAGGSSSPWR